MHAPRALALARRLHSGLGTGLGLSWAIPFGLPAALSVWLWWPALFRHRTIVFGDAIGHGWPLMVLHAAALAGRGSLLWSRDLYGGHPLFAEAQGGFAHPLNILFALLVTPLFGALRSMSMLHCAHALIGTGGSALLGRRIGLRPAANAFSALAICFSPSMLLQQDNITIGGALCFVPLSLWAFERWLEVADARSAALLAAVLALLFLAGYPQTLHALLLLLPFRLATAIAGDRAHWRRERGRRAATLLLAIMLFIGLIAVQLLPMLQLAALSHRAAGVAVVRVLKLRTVLQSLAAGDLNGADLLRNGDGFGVGSLLVCVPASLAMFLRGGDRGAPVARAYASGALLLLLVAAGDTPAATLLHDHGLLPGLQFFRITIMYLLVATVPLAMLAGMAIDRIGRIPRTALPIALAGWAGVLWSAGPGLSTTATATATAGLALLLIRPRRLGGHMLALLLVEIVCLRLHPFPFLPDRSVEREPETVALIRHMPDPVDHRLLVSSLSGAYGLLPPYDPNGPALLQRMLDSLVPMTTLDRSIPTLGGALALPLRRRMLAEPLLLPTPGASLPPAGARLLDLLAVRFVLLDRAEPRFGFAVVRAGDDSHGWLYRNEAARPLVQGFATHVSATDAVEAARRLATLRNPTLVIEDPAGEVPADPVDAAIPEVAVLDSTPTLTRLAVRSTGPGWVVLVDADYPGWRATLDGAPAPLFAGQLLAKAVPVPAGRHELVLRFRSPPFEIGLAISLASLIALAGLLLRR